MSDAEHTQEHMGKQPFTVLLMIPDHMQGDECCAADYIRRTWIWAEDVEQAEQIAPANCVNENEWQDICDPDELATVAIYPGHIFDLFQP